MMPMYMNSSQPDQMRPQGHYHQMFGNYPQHMTMDASSPASSCEHWPAPSPCYGSCVHGNYPAYTPYWPPCYPPQVPYHTCPVFHSHAPPYYIQQPFPVGYQPDKDVPGKHRCTNCSPQRCYPKNDRGVVIEEHEPEIEKGDHGELVRSTNCPYPIIWIPHENAWNQEHGSHDQPPAEIKAPESTKVQKSEPKSWNGCFPFDENIIKSFIENQDRRKVQNGKTVELPFDISKLKSLLQGQEGKEVQIQKNKQPRQLQYPIFWIPSHGQQEDVEASENRERGQEGSNLKGDFGCNVPLDAMKNSSVRNISVENHLQEPKNIPVKLLENRLPETTEPTKKIAKTESVENAKKEQGSSPPKASRLPPVCLRIDPLPKRKNGGSKSLSPPRRKEQPLTTKETKVASPMSSKKAETRTVPEACNVKCEESNKGKKMSEGCPNSAGTERESGESSSNLQEGTNFEIVKPCETTEKMEKPTKKTFAEEEAARIIQSRYRGYDVRRWEPIKKLKEIATVREQMGDVKKHMQALEVSTDQHNEGKEIIVLGEMVMSLLLKLDSIQGLHPSIRDFRKSLARELSDMQESLDSLKKISAEEEALEEQVEITSQTSDCPMNLEHSQLAEEKKMVHDSNTEKVHPPPREEHPKSLMNMTDEQLVAEAEERTLTKDPEPATERSISESGSTTIPDKIEAIEAVLPVNPSSADRNELTVTNIEEDRLKEPLHEMPHVVETTRGLGFEGLTEVSEIENGERKGGDGSVFPSEKDVEVPELLVGVIEDETQVPLQDSLSCAREAETTAIDPEAESQEETKVNQSCDRSKGIGQETAGPQEEVEVNEEETSEETIKVMEEKQRFKETMEALAKAGREQLEIISKLTGRIESLEKKLSQRKRTHIGRRKPNRGKQRNKPMSLVP
ncbi:hypothetical protein EUTSA_v10001302mg [Eutrema salsugineum]|uniref:BAG domain-containing protein n=1 Tax=Eutrema salsugineum TaxID=72664 RepID=V4LHK3_EUTSA|nr:BAG family molecular chaperone regulator 6 [Eutrema salsugineum]ESQ39263.1 hypothetical protein EUTSA_v10001302mg [Eutrema salsugineum]